MKKDAKLELMARRARALPSTGRTNERVLCARTGCGGQIGWIERAGADANFYRDESALLWDGPLAYREDRAVRIYYGPPVPRPDAYDYLVFRPGYSFVDGCWIVSDDARRRAKKRRQEIDRSGVGDHGRIDASKITPNRLPIAVACPTCRARQVLDTKTLKVHVLRRQMFL
jgi:hypothetical protein